MTVPWQLYKRRISRSGFLRRSADEDHSDGEDARKNGKRLRENRNRRPFSLNQATVFLLIASNVLWLTTSVIVLFKLPPGSNPVLRSSYSALQQQHRLLTARRKTISDDDEHIALPIVHKMDIPDDDEQPPSIEEENEEAGWDDLLPQQQQQQQQAQQRQQQQQTELPESANSSPFKIDKIDSLKVGTDGAQIDFVIGGFQKCGTTSLLHTLMKHPEIIVEPEEMCNLINPIENDNLKLDEFSDFVETLGDPNDGKKKGFKCPEALRTHKTIQRLTRHSPNAKFILGVRHPVEMLQSFYNYRVMEKYYRNQTDIIPDFSDLLQPEQMPWRGVSVESNRYEHYLLQFGKTRMTVEDMREMEKHPVLAVKPNQFQIFFFDMNQLSDTDEKRNAQLRNDLQEFLGLTNPIPPFGVSNRNTLTHEEYVDVCDSKYEQDRKVLMENSRKTADWVKNLFIEAEDVITSNHDHLVSLIDDWKVDPCEKKDESETTDS